MFPCATLSFFFFFFFFRPAPRHPRARSFALADYLASNITVQLSNPNFQTLLDIVAPISYADILSKIPKFIISASGDEFGLPDDILLYWDKFKGEKREFVTFLFLFSSFRFFFSSRFQ